MIRSDVLSCSRLPLSFIHIFTAHSGVGSFTFRLYYTVYSFLLLPGVMSLFLAPFVFDILADAIGGEKAWWILVGMVGIPLLGRFLVSSIYGAVWRRKDHQVHTTTRLVEK